MFLSYATGWWIAAGVLVAAELATGTFYLLMISLGAIAAAIVASLGFGLNTQLIVGAVLGGGAVAVWHFIRSRGPKAMPVGANKDAQLDIGERVVVPAWDAHGQARVQYRGAGWAARYAGAGAPLPGEHVIQALDGNCLLLVPAL